MKKAELISLSKTCFNEKQVKTLEQAIDFATKAHAGQKRKSGEAYISHPLSVAGILIDWNMDIDSVIAGVLHDTVEDTDATIDQIKNLFGNEVAKLVDGVTKVSATSAEIKNLDAYLPKTKDNLSKLLIAVGQDIRVIVIKLADRLHNLSTLQYLAKDKQQKVAKESLEIFGPMADRLGMGRVRMQIEELAFSYLDPQEFKRLKVLLKKRIGKSTKQLGQIKIEVEKALKDQSINAEINGRVKSIYSLHKKLAKTKSLDDIYDLMALRIIVDSKADCYQVLGILHTLYKPMINRIKDYISAPKINGYQSLHTTVITPSKQIVEFQIRTKGMHEFAERGLAAGFHYHASKSSKDYIEQDKVSNLPNNLRWISQLQEVVDKLKTGESLNKDQLKIDLFGDRIFVHSPKGDIYDLPEGALPLDFAYLIHGEVARHAYGFRVNGKIHSFDKPLKNGDVVEVITKKLSQPKQDWLKLVTTSHARSKLQSQLKKSGVRRIIDTAAKVIPKPLRK